MVGLGDGGNTDAVKDLSGSTNYEGKSSGRLRETTGSLRETFPVDDEA